MNNVYKTLIGGLSEKNKCEKEIKKNRKIIKKYLKNLKNKLQKDFKFKQFRLDNLDFYNQTFNKLIAEYEIDYRDFSDFIISKFNRSQKQRFEVFNKLYNLYIHKPNIDKPQGDSNDDKIAYLNQKINNLNFYNNCDNTKYKKHTLLGQGSFGEVFSIADVPDKVLKYIDLSYYTLDISDTYNDLLDNLIDEINISQELNETNISPTLHDYWLCRNNDSLHIVLVLEKMDISLSDWLAQGHSLSKEAYEILKDKVEQLHNKNIIHKDLYSRNVLLKYKDKCVNEVIPYISDFGRSKKFDSLITHLKQQEHNQIKDMYRQVSVYLKRIIVAMVVHTNKSLVI